VTGLPVEEVVDDIRRALDGPARAAVLQAPPGAGKTTVVPLRLLDEPWLAGGEHDRIVVLEPRRLAARAAARRMAALVGDDVGGLVGYRTRDDHRTSRRTRIEVVTEGILTRRLQHDPSLPGTGLVVFDELHERNLQSDLALAFALEARASIRPDLRLLAMSATLDATRVAGLLGAGTPVITSEGRQHPVDVRWAPLPPRGRLVDGTVDAVLRALRDESGDVLVFLPGAGEITRAQQALEAALGRAPTVDVRPLYGALSTEAQDQALQPSPTGRRRVVLATDIAETSLTVAGVRVVVDGGQARRPRYDARTGLTRLQTGPASKASADQRTGRAGRTEPGVAYRLWSKLEHAARRPHAAPEIAEVDLAGFALDLAIWGTEPSALALLDAPPPRALDEARQLLRRLGAIDDHGHPTADGRRMAELPLHPRLAHLVVRAADLGPQALATAGALAALLEERDVLRGHPDEVPVDAADRVRLIADRSARHPLADRGALAGARRRAGELLRRAGGGRLEDADPERTGLVLALAYPDRIAQARGNGRFRLRNGTGAWVPATDPLGREAFLVAADIQADRRADGRIRLAAALDADDVLAAAGADVTMTATLSWDRGRDDLRARTEHRLDGLVLRTAEGPADPADTRTVDALLERVRETRLEVLPWTDAARELQRRAGFAAGVGVALDGFAGLDEASLVADLDDWLAPALRASRAAGRADLAALDVHRLLVDRLGGHHVARRLDDQVPRRLRLARGRDVAVDYTDDRPTVRVRVQDAFGTATTPGSHPTIAGRPVVFELLSPAGRPIQITADLPGFWAGSWREVRKDLAGRYPKHDWPERPPA
jgi:ATP-dependent helicase HrpB